MRIYPADEWATLYGFTADVRADGYDWLCYVRDNDDPVDASWDLCCKLAKDNPDKLKKWRALYRLGVRHKVW